MDFFHIVRSFHVQNCFNFLWIHLYAPLADYVTQNFSITKIIVALLRIQFHVVLSQDPKCLSKVSQMNFLLFIFYNNIIDVYFDGFAYLIGKHLFYYVLVGYPCIFKSEQYSLPTIEVFLC